MSHTALKLHSGAVTVKGKRVVGIFDADMSGNGTTHPNLALMKISAWEKARGSEVRLLLDDYEMSPIGSLFGADLSDQIFVGKVFDSSPFPEEYRLLPHVVVGGTGFFGEKAPPLAPEIEAQTPDYHLYDALLARLGDSVRDRLIRRNYTKFSVGYATRGCFRKCEFCVVRAYSKVQAASPLASFVDPSRPFIRLWDDNILAFKDWERVFEELNATGKPFVFQQGLDIRLLNPRKARVLQESNYWNHAFIYAFDDVRDREIIEEKLKLWQHHSDKAMTQKGYRAKVYLLVGYFSQDVADVASAFTRVEILMRHQCLPYIMRYATWRDGPYRDFYVALAAWCNQPHRFLRYSFAEFVEKFGDRSLGATVRERLVQQMHLLRQEHPPFQGWFQMRYNASDGTRQPAPRLAEPELEAELEAGFDVDG